MATYIRVEDAPLDPRVAARQQERWQLTLVQLDAIQQKAQGERTRAKAAEVVATILRGQDPSDDTLLRITGLWYDACDEAEGRIPRSGAVMLGPAMARLGIASREFIMAGAAGVTVLSTAISLPLSPVDMIVLDSCAPAFLLSSLHFAGREWLTTGGSIPAEAFAQSAIRPRLNIPTVWPGVVMALTVENIDGANWMFRGWFDCIRPKEVVDIL